MIFFFKKNHNLILYWNRFKENCFLSGSLCRPIFPSGAVARQPEESPGSHCRTVPWKLQRCSHVRECLIVNLPMSLFPCRSYREHPSYAEHLQRSEGDHQPRRHGTGCHPQLLPSLPAVHPAVHTGGDPARHERKRCYRQQELPQVWQNHADYFGWWVLGIFPARSRCLCPCHPYLWPPGETAVSHIVQTWIESQCLMFIIPVFKVDCYFLPYFNE